MRLERITISKAYHDRIMASNTWRGLEALIAWSDSVTWLTKSGKHPILSIKFYKVEDFLRWKDWVVDTCMPYCYTVAVDGVVDIQIPVEPFFRSVVHPDKWHANNLR